MYDLLTWQAILTLAALFLGSGFLSTASLGLDSFTHYNNYRLFPCVKQILHPYLKIKERIDRSFQNVWGESLPLDRKVDLEVTEVFEHGF